MRVALAAAASVLLAACGSSTSSAPTAAPSSTPTGMAALADDAGARDGAAAPASPPAPREVAAHLVTRAGPDGTVAFDGGDREASADAARRLMAHHCGAGAFTIVREGARVAPAGGERPPGDVLEWRVDYRCQP